MKIRDITENDLDFLAGMNYQLIHDEGHRNPMSVDQLKDRMKEWLRTKYNAVLISSNGENVGYALWRDEPEFLYIRHFFISRQHRRKGIGRTAVKELKDTRWSGKDIRLEVLVDNEAGSRFWRALGFKGYCVTFEYKNV